MSACPRAADAVGGAFSALEPDEDAALRDHLASCATCRRALDEALEVGAALGAAVPQVDPPPPLRRRVLDAVLAEPAPPRPARPAPPRVAGPELDPPPGAAPIDRPRRRWPSLVGGLVVAVVLGLGLVVAGGVLSTQGGAPDTPAAALDEQADRVVADARSRDPSLRSAVLRGERGDAAAVVLDPADAAAPVRLVPLAMPPAPPAHDYVLWATGLPGNVPEAVAVMDPSDGVTRPLGAPTGPPAPGAPAPRGYAVSVEPAGPVPARPSTVVAAGLAA
ncbi:anti-sigma factor [Actinomycetospora cinnamomea]|uniref:Anti-sigma-K factor rskA n=1 Tax=Actinomycetospora cinnamomea TaxID=663609 RepID=A0A2U1FBA1_9PSEU|nr:anti-sigma factor [Actinomycetospora cinnamomea]PVZ09444.1 anti-sigma-K factor rskA [Actinomycetospora cinnamomea]